MGCWESRGLSCTQDADPAPLSIRQLLGSPGALVTIRPCCRYSLQQRLLPPVPQVKEELRGIFTSEQEVRGGPRPSARGVTGGSRVGTSGAPGLPGWAQSRAAPAHDGSLLGRTGDTWSPSQVLPRSRSWSLLLLFHGCVIFPTQKGRILFAHLPCWWTPGLLLPAGWREGCCVLSRLPR